MSTRISEKPETKDSIGFASEFRRNIVKRFNWRSSAQPPLAPLPTKVDVDTKPRDDDVVPIAPPPPYKQTSHSTPSLSTTVTNRDEASRRRARRLSKPPPSPLSNVDDFLSPTSLKALASSPDLNPLTPPRSPASLSHRRHGSASSITSIDSGGRPRPPVSGLRTATVSAAPKPPNSTTTTATTTTTTVSSPPASTSSPVHTYHYKRARAGSTADASRRMQHAVLCLEALLTACESGAVEDMRHVIEQVALARSILVGEEDGVGLAGAGSRNGNGNGNGSADEAAAAASAAVVVVRGKLGGASASVTSLATLSNLAV